MNIAGADLSLFGQEMLAKAMENSDDASLWMNLSIVMLCLGKRDIGLAMQEQALLHQRIYQLSAFEQPARFRLVMLMTPGDLAANTPLDCLLEGSDIDLIFYYLSPDDPLALPVPEHDALIVAISEADENHDLLAKLETALATWAKPVINAPGHIPSIGREIASSLLQDAPGLLIPITLRVSRAVLQSAASGVIDLSEQFDGFEFPAILRPVGSHAGRDLDKIDRPAELGAYLARVDGDDFYLSRFIDYSSSDGLFRKMRIALIDGKPFACHMAVSSAWMIHYVNAGMYDEAAKREEESSFMTQFPFFAERHRSALDAVWRRTKLDYVCVDCAETQDGQLLVFEIDHAMVVHAMDPEDKFPYKEIHMQKLKVAFRDFLVRLTGGSIPAFAA